MIRFNTCLRIFLILLLVVTAYRSVFAGHRPRNGYPGFAGPRKQPAAYGSGKAKTGYGVPANSFQAADTTDPMTEITNIMGNYSGMNHVFFMVSYYYSTTTGGGAPVIDSFIGRYQVNGDNYVFTAGSTTQIQVGSYHLVVHSDQALMELQRANYFFRTVMQMDVMDTTFQLMNVQGMTVGPDVGSNHKLTFQFYPESMYKQMSITYDSATFEIKSIYSKVSTQSILPADSASSIAQVININANFFNYQYGIVLDTVFKFDRYLLINNGTFTQVPPYDTFLFVNNTQD